MKKWRYSAVAALVAGLLSFISAPAVAASSGIDDFGISLSAVPVGNSESSWDIVWAVLIGLAVGFSYASKLKSKMTTVRPEKAAQHYIRKDSLVVQAGQENFIHKERFVTINNFRPPFLNKRPVGKVTSRSVQSADGGRGGSRAST